MADRRQLFRILFLFCFLTTIAADAFSQELVVTGLRCEQAKGPQGIDVPKPRLSWLLKSSRRGQKQTAYRVLVSSSREKLDAGKGDLWDSGKVASDQSHLVAYAGKALPSHQVCFWKVRSWDADGRPSQWSDTARWTMGILSPDGWQASWIMSPSASVPAAKPAEHTGHAEHAEQIKQVPLPIFRREFQASKKTAARRRVYLRTGPLRIVSQR